MGPHQPILLVEDSPEDYETTVRALRRAGLANPIFRCEDGDETLDFLYRRGRYAAPAAAPSPGPTAGRCSPPSRRMPPSGRSRSWS
jgi:hypothetical protein